MVQVLPDRNEIRRRVACPRCGANAGEPCVGFRNDARKALHQQRWDLYRKRIGPTHTPEWWLTILEWPSVCHECGAEVEDAPVYFRPARNPDERELLCEPCGEAKNLEAQPSKRYKAARR